MWQAVGMAGQAITADVCAKMVESATRSCQPMISVPPEPATSTADGLVSLATAFTYGSIVLAIVAIIAGLAWGKIVTATAEREAREMAEAEVRKWLQNEGLPLMMREANEFLRTFRGEGPISELEVNEMVRAAGADGKEGEGGKK